MTKNDTQPKRKLKSVEPRFVSWSTIGDKVCGVMSEKMSFHYKNGDEGTRYTITEDSGDLVQFNGTTQLNSLLGVIDIGIYVEITYVDDIQTDQIQPAKIFEVLREVE